MKIRQILKPDDLVGAKEAARLLRVHKSNFIARHARRPDFPKPIAVLASGRIWLRAEVLAYKATLGRNGRS